MKRWKISSANGVDPYESEQVVKYLLNARGISDREHESFLHPKLSNLNDPLRIPDMERAVVRVEEALRTGQRILIYSDYDVDGMTSSALMFRFLAQMGKQVDVFIPERLSEGYGLSISAIDRAIGEGKPDLLLALDCGTTSVAEVEYLNEKGIDVIIIDHHELAEKIPNALAFVNPQKGEHDHILATVGLVFKFCHAFLKMRDEPDLFDLKECLDLIAVGTVADIVPLKEDNRILVHHGLKRLAQTAHVGLQELMQAAGIRRRPTPVTIGFMIGPRLNASGRLAEAKSGWELLTTQSRRNAAILAQQLDRLNRDRQDLEQQATYEAEAIIGRKVGVNPKCVVVASREWHQGVIGIVASRLQKKWYCPIVVISIDEDGKGKGSGRSIDGCSLMDGLRHCQDLLLSFGGHAMAAGLEIEANQIDTFRERLEEWMQSNCSEEIYQEQLDIDMELPGEALNEELARSLGKLEPFGRFNEPPIFVIRDIQCEGSEKIFGKGHLRFSARVGSNWFDAVAFNMANELLGQKKFDVVGHWEIDDYSGKPCLRILDYKSSDK
ncbi:MAG: single-stranded-DNA-specific exonuclease RecJ [Verrucomicrobiota bacterium]